MATPKATQAATDLEKEFRRQYSFVSARLRRNAFARTTWILGFVGVVIITLTLLKTPHVDGGLPFPLKHEVLISITVFSSLGILLNLFVFFTHFLLWVNEQTLKMTQSPPSQDLIKLCIDNQQNFITGIKATDACSVIFGSLFWLYVLVVGVFGTFLPHYDPNGFTFVSGLLLQLATYLLWMVKLPIDGFPR